MVFFSSFIEVKQGKVEISLIWHFVGFVSNKENSLILSFLIWNHDCIWTNVCNFYFRLNQACNNTAGWYECNCVEGYEKTENNHCIDVNECAVGKSTCDPEIEICANSEGSFLCHCAVGYKRVGATCQDVNECARRKFYIQILTHGRTVTLERDQHRFNLLLTV